MEKRLVTEMERLLNSRHQNKRRSQVIRGLALLVVVATISALMMPAITMSNEVECGLEEHIHNESCYAVQQVAPQPVLTCTEGRSGETVIHTHDSFCYDSQGNLICTLPEVEAHTHGPECYQERRTLICQEIPDPGHQHSASCYSYVKVENADVNMAPAPAAGEYVCGMQEGEGAHRHTDSCYPKERTERLACAEQESEDVTDEEGNVIVPGHHHDSSCYVIEERPIYEKFICTQEESEDEYDSDGSLIRQGHHHDDSCWLRGDELCFQEGCRQHESAGHQHTDACVQTSPQESVRVDGQGEQWEQTLICQETEREPGHVHTDECYEITQVLACQKTELEPHTHGVGCYDEGGALVCGRPEIRVHQHTEACFTTPEGGPEEAEVLICGREEHTHTDLCYVKTAPEKEKYYCGLEEHTHTAECYFESGTLRCTIPEHYHTDDCLVPPAEESEEPEESPEPEESQLPDDVVEVKDAEFVYDENPAFVVTFKINGFARVSDDQPEQLPQDDGPVFSGEELTEIIDQAVPLAAMPRMMSMSALMDDAPDSGPGLESVFTPAADEHDSTPAPGSDTESEGTAVGNSSQPILPAVSEPVPEISFEPVFSAVPEISSEPTPDLEEEKQLELVVEQLRENDPEYQRVAANAQTELGEEESTVMDVLRVAFYAGRRKMDLSSCEVTAVIEATQELRDAMEAQTAMTAGEDEAFTEETEEQQEESSFAMTDGEGGIVAFAKVSEPMVVTLSDEIMALSAVAPQPYPVFQVQYYAYLHTVDTTEGANANKPTLINTNNGGTNGGGKLPVNGNLNLPAIHMEVDANGTIKTLADNSKVTKIFNDHKFSYETAPHRNYIDIVTKQGGNYSLAEIWVMDADGETVKKDADGKEMKYPGTVQLTNNATTAGKYPDEYVLVEDDTILRMVYKTTDGGMNVDSNFHDYDVSDGKVYSKADKNSVTTWPGKDSSGKYMYTKDVGIHTPDNYSGTGAKYAFGNGDNVSTGLGTQMLGGYFINRANNGNDGGGASFQNCSFGMVQNTLSSTGGLQFKSGIAAPNLFSGSAVGRTDYNDGSLGFTRKGDTYTLSTASVGGNTLGNLDKLAYHRGNWNNTLTMFSNEFWPLDNVDSAGTAGHDLMFGKIGGQHYTFGAIGTKNTLESDYKHPPQNGLHNPYFGMDFSVDFTVYPDYVGPLEYYFFGDDDMWVYLSPCDKDGNLTGEGKLICDIGGVHGAVGEYVNLWDYIPKNDTLVDDSDPDKATASGETHYKLSFFYTERGASGSTCWMQFTLPELRSSTFRTPTSTDYATLEISKAVLGPPAEGKAFHFTLQLMNADGTFPTDITASVYRTGGPDGGMGEITGIDWQANNGKLEFDLENGQTIFLKDLPKNIQYTITEDTYDGYTTSYTVTDVDSNSGSTTKTPVEGTVASGTLTGGHIVTAMCRNVSSYELPQTGGAGATYTMAGVPLMAMLCLWYKKKRQGEGAVDQ